MMSVPAEYLVFKVNIYKKVLFITLAASLAALLLGQRGFATGFFIGGLLSMAIFSLLYKYVLALRNLALPRRKRFIMPRALLIYAIMGVALAIGIKKGIPVFIGTAAGLLSLKIAVFIQVFQERNAGA